MWITAATVRDERIPLITTAVLSDAVMATQISRAEATIIAAAGKYRELLQGHVYGELVNLGTTGIGNRRTQAQGGETTGTLSQTPVVSSSYFIFRNVSRQDYRHIRGDEGNLLEDSTDYALNASTGVITFDSGVFSGGLGGGDVITATYDFTMDTTNQPPAVIVNLAKSLVAYWCMEIVYGENRASQAGEVKQLFQAAEEDLKALRKNTFAIPEFDDIDFVLLEEWQPGEVTTEKIIRA